MRGKFDKVYQFRLALRNIEPPIWRRILVPSTYTFWDLHVAIQDAMGWQDYHLHEFRMTDPETGDPVPIGMPDDFLPYEERALPGWGVPIADFFTLENPSAEYEYDFGDSWEHEIVLEEILRRDGRRRYPSCVGGERACPPEDCGGVGGYMNFLQVIHDPTDQDHRSLLAWTGGSFDPEGFDPKGVRFDDPRVRWVMAFTTEEEDDEETQDTGPLSGGRGGAAEDDDERRPGPRFIMGDGVTLRQIERDDVRHVRRWLDDPELRAMIGTTGPMSEADAEVWFADVVTDPARAWYVIVRDEDDRVIGEAGLLRMFPEWRTTDMSIIIGERDAWGKGYGTEVGRLLLEFAFEYMGFHRVGVGVVGFHESAIRFWEKLGFRKEGVQRDGYVREGAFHDFVMMSILEDEWRERRQSAAGGGRGETTG